MSQSVADRASRLQSRRHESGSILRSRKRKLRELYLITTDPEPVPQINILTVDDDTPSSAIEARILDESDLTKGRKFNEDILPKRTLRSDTQRRVNGTANAAAAAAAKNNAAPADATLTPKKDGHDEVSRKGRGTTPRVELSTPTKAAATPTRSPRRGRSATSPRDGGAIVTRSSLPEPKETTPLETIPDVPMEDASPDESKPDTNGVAEGPMASEHIKKIESPPGSPGVDPRKAVPISAEDAAQLKEPLIKSMLSQDPHHKAATIHLPPKEVMEARQLERKKQLAVEKANRAAEQDRTPARLVTDTMVTEAASSPSSTVGAHSATTPALHDASTDTSPENDGARFPDKHDEKDGFPQTPPELEPASDLSAEEQRRRELLQAQIAVSRHEILESSPTTADAQLRFEERQAAAKSSSPADSIQTKASTSSVLVRNAREVAEDIIEDEAEEDEVVGVPTPDDTASRPAKKPKVEIEDTDSSSQELSGDAMDIDGQDTKEKGQRSQSRSETLDRSSKTSAPSRQAPEDRASRQKTDVLNEIPRPNTTPDRPTTKSQLDPESAVTAHSPDTSHSAAPKSFVERAKEKHKSRLSTVVFSKTPKKDADGTLIRSNKPPPKEPVDYLMPLFLTQSKAQAPIEQLIASAHKTITTTNAYVPINESQTCRILKRIYNLQSMDKWSLRQPKRAPEPTRPMAHWDVLLREMKWMRTDFREERKWKHAVARNLAYACAEFVAANEEDKKLLQVKATIKSTLPPKEDVDMADLPDLVETKGEDSPLTEFDDEPVHNMLDTVAPAEIFSLGADDVVFGLQQSAVSERLLKELPLFGSPLPIPESDLTNPSVDPDKLWRRPALPISKYVEGKIELKQDDPPRKKSRYDYDTEDDDEDTVVVSADGLPKAVLAPEMTEVALFNPGNKHIRDRIHWGHQFRPPSEYPMPLQSFFESRCSSQWTYPEDDELKNLVREHSYNWSLISSLLTSRSLFTTGAERRTPWECFERWVSLEGLPSDMGRTNYFKMWNTRIDTAQKNLMAQAPQPPPQNGAGNVAAPIRRRSTISMRVERRRNTKHLSLLDAMRKQAKKRETAQQKQQHAAGMAAIRKNNENTQPRQPQHTPQEFSRLKHERELVLQERMAVYQQRHEAQRRAALLQGRQPQHAHSVNGQPQARTPGVPNAPNSSAGQQLPNNSNSLSVPSQGRPQVPGASTPNGLPSQPQMPNGVASTPQMPIKGLPQGLVPSMQGMPGMQGQQRLPNTNGTPDLNLVLQAQRISAQQRQAVQLQQSQQMQGQQLHNSPPNMRSNLAMTQQLLQNGQMLAAFNNGNASGANGPNVNANGAAGSPRAHPNLPAGVASAQFANLEAQLHAKFPNAPQEQIRRMVNETIQKTIQAQQQRQALSQSAMHAAAGGAGTPLPGQPLPSGIHQSPQLYAQMLRQQQAQQAQRQAQAQAQQAALQNGQAHQANGNVSGKPSMASPSPVIGQAQPQLQGQGAGAAGSQTPKTPQLAQAGAATPVPGGAPHSRSASAGSGVGVAGAK